MEFCSVIQQTLSSNFWSVISSWFVPDDSVLCSSRQKYLSHHFYSLWSEFLLARPPDYSKHLWRLLAQPADRWPDHLSGHQTNHLCLEVNRKRENRQKPAQRMWTKSHVHPHRVCGKKGEQLNVITNSPGKGPRTKLIMFHFPINIS